MMHRSLYQKPQEFQGATYLNLNPRKSLFWAVTAEIYTRVSVSRMRQS
jgi:hypothetical protein